MSPPAYVKLCTLLAEGLLLAPGLRNLMAPGAMLPILGDAEFTRGLFGDVTAGTLDGRRALALSQLWGALIVAFGMVKLVTIFTNPEGTFLRRNLMLTIGFGDVLLFAFLQASASRAARAVGCTCARVRHTT